MDRFVIVAISLQLVIHRFKIGLILRKCLPGIFLKWLHILGQFNTTWKSHIPNAKPPDYVYRFFKFIGGDGMDSTATRCKYQYLLRYLTKRYALIGFDLRKLPSFYRAETVFQYNAYRLINDVEKRMFTGRILLRASIQYFRDGLRKFAKELRAWILRSQLLY
jgi:hypothetical protein